MSRPTSSSAVASAPPPSATEAARPRRGAVDCAGLFRVLRSWSPARIALAILLFSTLGGQVIVAAMSLLFHGRVRVDYIVTGVVTAAAVSLVVAVVANGLLDLLQRAERRAQEANASKSLFLANMSHEIRTPLHAITGLAHLMRRDALDAIQVRRLDQLEAAGDHLLGIIDAILDLSKIEAGQMTLDTGPVQVAGLVDHVVAMMVGRLRGKGVNLRCEVAPLPATLLGDPTRLRQALLNYVGNAIKFTDRGEVWVRVARVDEDAASVVLRFEVEDPGIGIDSQALADLFQPFQRVDGTSTRQRGGTGLGLAITRRLAQLMGGDAGATSTPGQGSRFWFTARLAKGRPDLPAAARTADRQPGPVAAELQGRRVLLVDNDPVNQDITAQILAAAGATVDVADGGRSAVEQASCRRFDLILMDLHMPDMDGLEATRRIRATATGQGVPILALTASAMAGDRAVCLGAGMEAFISKPVKPRDLLAAVQRWLAQPAQA